MDTGFVVASGLFLGSFAWVVGVPVGYALAVRSAHRSSLRRENHVFRGLAFPWDRRVGALKAFPLWVISVVATTVGFAVLSFARLEGTFLVAVAVAAVFSWNALAGFQKGILPAERVFFRVRGTLGVLRGSPTTASERGSGGAHMTIVRREQRKENEEK